MNKPQHHTTLGRPRGGRADCRVDLRISKAQVQYIQDEWPSPTEAIRAGLDLLMAVGSAEKCLAMIQSIEEYGTCGNMEGLEHHDTPESGSTAQNAFERARRES